MNERVTVDFDSESYYLDGEYWESWDNYGEEMADAINEVLEKQDKIIKNKESLIKAKNEQLDDVKQILQKHNQTEILKELGWD